MSFRLWSEMVNTATLRLVYLLVATVSVLLPIHVVAGGMAIVLGGVALLGPKATMLHRRSQR